LAQAMSEDRYLSLFVEGSPIMRPDPRPREPRSVWPGLLATGAAVVLVAQIAWSRPASAWSMGCCRAR
jgi:hypothetical protein